MQLVIQYKSTGPAWIMIIFLSTLVDNNSLTRANCQNDWHEQVLRAAKQTCLLFLCQNLGKLTVLLRALGTADIVWPTRGNITQSWFYIQDQQAGTGLVSKDSHSSFFSFSHHVLVFGMAMFCFASFVKFWCGFDFNHDITIWLTHE